MPKTKTKSETKSSTRNTATASVGLTEISRRIHLLREARVMLDADLAELYGVTTGNLNKAVQRNLDRFPAGFMFQLSATEFKDLKFQFGRSSLHGGHRTRPFAFAEVGGLVFAALPPKETLLD